MTDPKADSIIEITERDFETKIRDFGDLLKDIENLSDKKRELWKNIYENAISDRTNSFIVFKQVFTLCGGKSTELAVHAKTLTSCVERMAKANDQLIKLAELIAHAEHKDGEVDADELFDRINKGM
jgi:hypothetical protein